MGSNATFGEISPFSCTQMWIEMVHGHSLGHGKCVPLEDLIKLLEFSLKSRVLYRRVNSGLLTCHRDGVGASSKASLGLNLRALMEASNDIQDPDKDEIKLVGHQSHYS